MDSIPDEIWADIFKRSFLWDPHNPVFIEPSYKCDFYQGTPFLPSYVCSKWRKISLEDRSLWSTITISGGPPQLARRSIGSIWPNTQRIKLWFERSGPQRPLSISFDLHALQNKEAKGNPGIISCFRLFISLIPRWGRVLLCAPDEFYHPPVISPDEMRHAAAMLEYFETQYGYGLGDIYKVYPWILQIIRHSPNLRMLFLREFSAAEDVAVSISQLPPSQLDRLQYLHLNCLPPSDLVIDILRSSGNLISCSIKGVCQAQHSRRVNDASPITLPYLCYFHLEGISRQYHLTHDRRMFLSPILHAITTPSLVNLILVNDADWDSHLFQQFLARSKCTLRHLIFNKVIMSSTAVLECLRANPSLIEFRGGHIQRPSSSDNRRLLTALQSYGQASEQWSMAPLLEDLVLDSTHLIDDCNGDEPPKSASGSFVEAMATRLTSNPARTRVRRVGFTNARSRFFASRPEQYHVRFEQAAREALSIMSPDLAVVSNPPMRDEEWRYARSWLM